MSLMMSPKGAKSAILQAQESSEVVGDQSHKGGYRRVSTLGHGNGNVQLRDAPESAPRCPQTGAQTPEC